MSGPRKPPTKAERIVEMILEDIVDRRGLGDAWADIDTETQDEIKGTWVRIIEGEDSEDSDDDDEDEIDEESDQSGTIDDGDEE